jgi:hypothetical protein
MELGMLYYVKPDRNHYDKIIQWARQHPTELPPECSMKKLEVPLIKDSEGKDKI